MPNVIIVSNRLPVSVKKVDGGRLKFSESVGGLSKGLSSYAMRGRNKWIGWPGIVSEELTEQDRQDISRELRKHNCYPVFLTQKQLDDYYNGYSNDILWPFFHNLDFHAKQSDRQWKAYRTVNKLFCEAVLSLSSPRSTIWVHDYQLLLLPEMLRAERPYDSIGLFFHIPFPSAESFVKLRQAKALLRGILGADVAGFHTQSYVNNFLDSCSKLNLGIASPGQVILPDHVVRVTDFPIGIDYQKYAAASKLSAVKREVRKLKRKFGGLKVILTVDRMDPTKGLVERLIAYRELLWSKPELHGKVVLVMQAAPSRTDISAYRRLKEDVEHLVADINNSFGTKSWQPVDYRYTSASFEEVAALYHIADVAFITPIRDGMNLVAKEFVASKTGQKGVLILSETAGAAQELSDAILVNPSRPKSLVRGLERALAMRPAELRRRLGQMQDTIAGNTIQTWAGSFMKSLQQPIIDSPHRTRRLSGNSQQKLLVHYTLAKKRLILLDYDGVLAAFVGNPKDAKPSAELKAILTSLSTDNGNQVFVVSGRSKQDLERWFGRTGIGLAAEHGAIMKPPGKPWQQLIDAPNDWKTVIKPTLVNYASKTPGAFVEEKDYSLVWHYRESPAYHAQKNIVVLRRALQPMLRRYGLKLFSGNKILEIKSADAHKGIVAAQLLNSKPDFILSIGDDYTDEDMFAALPAHAYTVKVGHGKTLAHYRLSGVKDVSQLLEKLANAG